MNHSNDHTSLAVSPITSQASISDRAEESRRDEIVAMWIAGKSRHTQRAYVADAHRLFCFLGKSFLQIGLADLQFFCRRLELDGLSAATRRRIIAAVKSLFSFAAGGAGGIGYLPMNPAVALLLPKPKDALNERILSEECVAQLIAGADTRRNRIMIELLYRVGLRVDELVNLCWSDVASDTQGALLTVYGKGEKTRVIRIGKEDSTRLLAPPPVYKAESPIFQSRNGRRLSTSQAWRIVKAAAHRAGITSAVSPHWLRHCHATHAIDHGADIRIVQHTLGHSSPVTTERYIRSRPTKSSGSFLPPAESQ